MKKHVLGIAFLAVALLAGGALLLAPPEATHATPTTDSAEKGTPTIQSMSALLFGEDGTLYVGDARAGAVFAIATNDEKSDVEPINVPDLEGRLASLMGTSASEIMVHDLAVHPLSNEIYLSVSRGRAGWDSRWKLPNHVADAQALFVVRRDASIEEVSLEGVQYTKAALSNPIDAEKKHQWQGDVELRTDTITDMAIAEDTLFVAGLSNEDFASTLWRIPLPFQEDAPATTLEIYHGAHGAYETHAPIRTFVPYEQDGTHHILGAYLCTPLVSFKVDDLAKSDHLRGRTIAELGSGNYPLDMVVLEREDRTQLVIANSNLPLILIDTKDIRTYEGEITERVEGYIAGVKHEARSGTGIQQLDLLSNTHLVTLQRMPSGSLDLQSQALRR